MAKRGVAPAVGLTTMVLITVVLAALLGGMFFGIGLENPPEAVIRADVDGNAIDLTHRSGDPLRVTDLTVRVYVDGEPLEQQPTVPATGMEGFVGIPSGPFNSNTDRSWSAGETAGFAIARTTNAPQPSPGDRVVVRIVVGDHVVAVAETRAR